MLFYDVLCIFFQVSESDKSRFTLYNLSLFGFHREVANQLLLKVHPIQEQS